MSTETSQVRPQHSADKNASVVAVTGAASGVGHVLLQRLLAAQDSGLLGTIVGIDDHCGVTEGVTWRVADIRDPALASRLSDVDVLVHAADDRSLDAPSRERRTRNVRAAQTLLTAAAAERVSRVILITSTMIYGATSENPVPLPEDAPVAPDTDAGVIGDFIEVEDLASFARRAHPALSVTVLRPAPLVGPEIDTLLARHFSAPRLLTVKGWEQAWQFCHIDDLASAVEFVIVHDVHGKTGAIAVGCEGALRQSDAEDIAELRRFELPANLALGATQRLHRVGLAPAPASELKFLVYPCVVDCVTLRDAGWQPEYDNAEALGALLEARGKQVRNRNVGRKEVTITAASAAGAAAAAIGTAAAVRRLRKRRRG